MKKTKLIALSFASLLIISGCHNDEPPQVVASSFIAYDLVRAVVGDTLTFKMIIPPGIDLHSYNPTPRDIEKINQAELFVYTSNIIEPWAKTANKNSSRVLNLGDAIPGANDLVNNDHDEHGHGVVHYWTSPANIKTVISRIESSLSELDSENAGVFHTNANNYVTKIDTVSKDFLAKPLQFDQPIFYVGHNALDAFADYFNLTITTLVEGIRPDHDVTGAELSKLINAIKAANVHYLFTEELSSPNFKTTIINELARENYSLTVHELHGYHNLTATDFNTGVTYYDLLVRNLNYLAEALA